MQLTGQNRFTRILSGSYRITNGIRVLKLFFKNGRRSNRHHIYKEVGAMSQWKLALKRVKNGKWQVVDSIATL